MATIDGLPPARAASDGDALVLSQAGVLRRASRAQLLAGMQAELALASGTLLGRAAAGVGAPEAIRLGGGLVLANGTLSAPLAGDVTGLPEAQAPGAGDLVALAQGGRDVALPFGSFMAGLAQVPDVDGSGLRVGVAGGVGRRLSDALAEGAGVEAFGAVGDGVTDDTAAFVAALGCGRAVRLGARRYAVGPLVIAANVVLLGVPGASVLCRVAAQGDWITFAGGVLHAEGIGFDAGGSAGDAVVVGAACVRAVFEGCAFEGAGGRGLVVAGTGAGSGVGGHLVRGCAARGNRSHGIVVPAAGGTQVLGCSAQGNGGDGLRATACGGPAGVRLVGNTCRGNGRGIVVEGAAGGIAVVADNECVGNRGGGIVVSGVVARVTGNVVTGDLATGEMATGGMAAGNAVSGTGGAGVQGTRRGGIAVRSASVGSRVAGNLVCRVGMFGIDVSGSVGCDVAENHVSDAVIGVDASGAQGLRVAGNVLLGNGWGVLARGVAPESETVATSICIEGNRIGFSASTGGGVWLADGPVAVRVERNAFEGTGSATPAQALWAHTESVLVEGNRWNGVARHVCNPLPVGGLQAVVFPDVADAIMVTRAPDGVQSLLGAHQLATLGQVTFVRVTAGGTGYRAARVVLHGEGAGAAAVAHLAGGRVIGVSVTDAGSGYGATGFAGVSIEGDGSGAVALAYVGLPVPEERRLRVACNAAIRFARTRSVPRQENWTGYDVTVPGNSVVEFVGTFGAWQAVGFPPADYVSPDGDGGVTLRSAGGDLTLRPSGGRVMVACDDEPEGYAACAGRGSPVGRVSAPPGSEYRNLDGGAGATLWVKQVGADAGGWIAIA